MFEGIARPIYTWPLAIPDSKHAIDSPVRIGFDLLGAQNRRCRKVFVNGRQKFDVVLVEKTLRAPQFQIDHAER